MYHINRKYAVKSYVTEIFLGTIQSESSQSEIYTQNATDFLVILQRPIPVDTWRRATSYGVAATLKRRRVFTGMFEIKVPEILQEHFITAWKVSVLGLFVVRIFPHSDLIRRDTSYLSVFSPNARKCRPEKLRIWTLCTQC